MKIPFFKLFALTVLSALVLLAVPLQHARASGEPNPPSELVATSSYPGDLAISLSWVDNSFDETGFEIERCIGVDCTNFSLYATRDSSIYGPWFNDVGLAEVTSYSYRVRAVNAAGASTYSNVASATTSYARPDGQITSLVGTFTASGVELSWVENATNETRFEIERYEVGAGGTAFEVVGTVGPDATTFIDSTALKGTSYDYRVVPWRFDISGGAPIVVNVLTDVGIDAPTGVNATASAPMTIRVTWKGKYAPDTQVVVQRENCDIYYGCYGWLTIGQVDASIGRYIDTGLLPATLYTYRVRAVNTTSVSMFTDPVSATTRR